MSNIQPLKWHGGKGAFQGKLAKWIIDQAPPHEIFLDGCFGGGQVLFNKPYYGIIEYANDVDGELMNFWQVLQSPLFFETFCHWVNSIPLSEVEFKQAEMAGADAVTRAVRFFVRNRQSRQALGRDYVTPTTRTRRGMNEQVSAWLSAVEGLPAAHQRLQRVEIWNRPVVEAIARLNRPQTLVYLDPPYVHASRVTRDAYTFEMSERAHAILLATLQSSRIVVLSEEQFNKLSGDESYLTYFGQSHVPFDGKFMLSGYRSQLYEQFAFLNGWRMEQFQIANNASSALKKQDKTECLWKNYQ